ncbi:MAG TPA: metal-sulfur cluster assembly factor [Candidatus Baltobacteraceae bacterium]
MIDEQSRAHAVLEALRQVIDPELGIDVLSLGLIYRVSVDGDAVEVDMTVTVPGCPMHATIMADAEHAVRSLGWAREVTVSLTFEPPWGPERLSPEACERLGR